MATVSAFGFGGWDPVGSIGEGMLNSAFAEHSAEKAFKRQKELAELNYQNNLRAMREGPQAMREGLVTAGYNPILAVNSAGGASFSNSIPGAPQANFSPSNSRSEMSLDGFAKMAMIRQTDAQTDFIKKRTLGEGWVVKTLSASEARGLGANFARVLGLHFNGSDSQTFLVAYNPITGEMRNIANTDSLGSTGETNDAATVRYQFEDDAPVTLHYRRGEEQPYKATYDHTSKFNLPR